MQVPKQSARPLTTAGYRDRFVYHVTINTGHTRKSYRDEVDDGVVEICRALLAQALKGERPVIPGTGGCTLSAETSRKRGLLCSVWPPETPIDGSVVVQESEEIRLHFALAIFAIAPNSLSAAVLWRLLVETARTPVVPMECPPAPFCAVRLEQGAANHVHVLPVLADLERCIAWAWLEK